MDKEKPSDCANEPHEITHAPDALRGFSIYYARPKVEEAARRRGIWSPDMWEDFMNADEEGKKYIKLKYGEPL